MSSEEQIVPRTQNSQLMTTPESHSTQVSLGVVPPLSSVDDAGGESVPYSFPARIVTFLFPVISTVQVLMVTESQPEVLQMGSAFAKLGIVIVTTSGTDVPATYSTGGQSTVS